MYPKYRYSPLSPSCVASHSHQAHSLGLGCWGTPPILGRKRKGFIASNLVMVNFVHLYVWLLIMEIVIIWETLFEKISVITVCRKWLKHQLIFFLCIYTYTHTLNISSFKNKDTSDSLFKSCILSPHLPLSTGDFHLF